MPHLLAAISAHGYGHLAQSTAVLNTVRRRLPALRLTLYTPLPRSLLAARIDGDFELIGAVPDIGMLMHDAIEVDVAASAAAYRAFHAHWQDDVALEAARLRAIAPDALFADVPYRPLAAAQQADIPSIALCSLNWADIYQHYCGTTPEAAAILAQITAAYAGAAAFLRPAPSMPMATLPNAQPVGPIARIGRARRSELAARCGGSPTDRYVLLSLGGIPTRLDMRRWPRHAGTHWIVPAEWRVARADMTAYEELGLGFVDVLCSADVLLTKPGYGSFAEAACNGVPVLYVPRKTWPEAPYLERWLARHSRCVPITWEQLERGDLSDALARLLAMAPAPPMAATGVDEAADHLLRLLAAGRSSSSEPAAP